MSSTGNNLQGFPQNASGVVNPDTGYTWTPTWLRWAMNMWIRTGTAQGGTSAPTGSGQSFFGPVSAIPAGWLLCDGSEIDRVQYAALFSVIGTYWGAGDGSTTFNIPNMQNRVLVGAIPLAFASRGGAIPTTTGTIGYAAINFIIKQ